MLSSSSWILLGFNTHAPYPLHQKTHWRWTHLPRLRTSTEYMLVLSYSSSSNPPSLHSHIIVCSIQSPSNHTHTNVLTSSHRWTSPIPNSRLGLQLCQSRGTHSLVCWLETSFLLCEVQSLWPSTTGSARIIVEYQTKFRRSPVDWSIVLFILSRAHRLDSSVLPLEPCALRWWLDR